MHVLENLLLGFSLSVASIDNTYIVSPSKDSEKFYLELSRSGALDEGFHTREDVVCVRIFRHLFFKTNKSVEVVDASDTRAYAQFHPEGRDWSMFTRPYHVFNVSVPPNVTHQEALFPCLAKFKETNELKMYLISHAYDFNRWIGRRSTKCPEEVPGHFLFEYTNADNNVARLIAVAEKPADLSLFIESIREKKDFENAKYELDAISNGGRSICEFAAGWKVRICSVGINAVGFGALYSPLENRNEPECGLKTLAVEHLESSGGKPTRTIYEFNEWVIGCKAERFTGEGDSSAPLNTFYVSLGYEPYQFLIYHFSYFTRQNVDSLWYQFYSYLGEDNSGYIQSTSSSDDSFYSR